MILPIYLYGWPLLRRVSDDIPADYPRIGELIADMFATMYAAEGIGLAAPQIGLNIRLIVIDAKCYADEDPALKDFVKVFVNPHIIGEGDGMRAAFEGCLSLPGLHEEVCRPGRVRMTYLDENFARHDDVFTGLAARVIQHEYDHLEGKMFIDRLSPIRRKLLSGKLGNMAKGKVSANYKYVSVKR